ncbi:Rho termination factor N-terminal domain-containing protein [Prochlorothrix hollandica]|uniref:Transcription termination factor rho family protein n=1 Tax=Prochlorothrix hollandica PCC 9006 = CALU 1027 TaxID=317619 RepID=A0A0M2PYY2_PROHO|nr:Rho termination factor N-terminal domain-containing protein [Prochlorothrix hollandica]KKJ01350.1 transcription termination factor rho family protein [Prochlorothrix hollandica PCC 9006 = CALU 1027]
MNQEPGSLIQLYLEEIDIVDAVEVHEFVIASAATAIANAKGRNWVPVIVKQVGAEAYEAIANGFIVAAAEEAGLHKVWCLVVDGEDATHTSVRALTQAHIYKINLATASRDQIKVALDYLINRTNNPLKGVKLLTATERIAAAPRQYWKESLMDLTALKCGITKGAKLNILKEVFYTVPEALPDRITDAALLTGLTVTELKKMAKEQAIEGYSKMKKADLVKALSQT